MESGAPEPDACSEEGGTTVDSLPRDFLRLLLASLDVTDMCAAACSCSCWNSVSLEQWPRRARERWAHGWAQPRWEQLQRQGKHLQVYAERHQARSMERDAWAPCP